MSAIDGVTGSGVGVDVEVGEILHAPFCGTYGHDVRQYINGAFNS